MCKPCRGAKHDPLTVEPYSATLCAARLDAVLSGRVIIHRRTVICMAIQTTVMNCLSANAVMRKSNNDEKQGYACHYESAREW